MAARWPGWVFGFQDEVWFSRLAQPALRAWAPDHPNQPLRLHQKDKQAKDKEPEALACYGLLRHDTGDMMLRFVEGRPVSAVTTAFLEWVAQELAGQGVRVLVIAWDNASWHKSAEVRRWIQAHNQRLKPLRHTPQAGCHVLVCPLPVKSPWLNAIEPKWVHGKKNIVEPQRKLAAHEIKQRLCDYYPCPLLPPLVQ